MITNTTILMERIYKRMTMRTLLIILSLTLSFYSYAQNPVSVDDDPNVFTEYYDGLQWVYKQQGDFMVGMTIYLDEYGYGKNYQILVSVKNLGEASVLFDPSLVVSTMTDKYGDTEQMVVYSYERYMKRVNTQQTWAMALLGFSSGVSSELVSLPVATTTHLMTLNKMMSDDNKMISQGYLKKTTLYPYEGILGYINIKYKRGKTMTIFIPIEDQVFTFGWDVTKKKE